MRIFSLALLFLFSLVFLVSPVSGLAPIQGLLTDAEGQPLPLESYEEILHFLNTARVGSS